MRGQPPTLSRTLTSYFSRDPPERVKESSEKSVAHCVPQAISRPFAPHPFHEAVDVIDPQQSDTQILPTARSDSPAENISVTGPAPMHAFDEPDDEVQLDVADWTGTQTVTSPHRIDIDLPPETSTSQCRTVAHAEPPSDLRPRLIGTVLFNLDYSTSESLNNPRHNTYRGHHQQSPLDSPRTRSACGIEGNWPRRAPWPLDHCFPHRQPHCTGTDEKASPKDTYCTAANNSCTHHDKDF